GWQGGRRSALKAVFEAHFMRVSWGCRSGDVPEPIFVLLRPLGGLLSALIGRPTIAPSGVAGLARLAQIGLADPAAVAVEAFEAPARAEGLVRVVDRRRQFHAAPQVAAPLARYAGGRLLDRRHFKAPLWIRLWRLFLRLLVDGGAPPASPAGSRRRAFALNY